ncbi:hypothetical protein K2F54_08980 [Cryobacterium sp. 1639]|uniref:hypothetical protein n=1 Tax=Cryobacterium inferilacus TaxID=2866629 RepID=UPI001C72BCE2|nr:hypothetical protein [Cryobacterium sp. 1639]MBX0300111.1 hypothetical protein [Cryobacterium sp. 1639]
MVAVAGAGLLLFAAAGCATAPEPVQTSTVPTAAPVFASDEEALAAATEAYANYLALSSAIAHAGGNDAQRISEVTTGEALDTEIQSMERLSEAGTTGVGELKFDTFTIQSAELSSGSVSAYVCLDVSATDVVDATGTSVLTGDRRERLPLEIAFIYDDESRQLLLERTRTWDGESFCSPQ